MRIRSIFTLLFACAFICAGAKTEKNDYKHDNCYNYKRALEAAGNEEYDVAIQYLNAEIAEHKDCDRAYQRLAVIYAYQGEAGTALSSINLAIKHCPKKDVDTQAANHLLKAQILGNLYKYDEAEAEYTTAIDLAPEESKYYYYRGQFYYDIQKFEQSLADFKKASELEPGLAANFVYMGMNLEAMERYQEAYENYDYACRLSPSDYTAQAYRGDALLKMKKYNDAINCYIEVLNNDNSNQAASNGLAAAFAEVPEVAEAKMKAQHIKNPKDNMWSTYLAVILENNKKYDEAIKLYQQMLVNEPVASYYSALVNIYKKTGDYQLALENIEKAIECDSEDIDLLFTKASVLNDLGQRDEAVKVIDECIEQSPESVVLYIARSSILRDKKEFEGALTDVNTAINLSEVNCENMFYRGLILQRMGKKEEAAADFQYILENDSTESWFSAFANVNLGNEETAIKLTQAIIANDSNGQDSGEWYNAACVYSLLNKKDEALKCFGQCLEAGYCDFEYIKVDCDLDNIRNTNEFKALVKKYQDKLRSKLVGGKKDEKQYVEVTCEVPYTRKSGVTQVKCQVNGLPLHFIFDTGAANISISSVEAQFMLKNDYLSAKDVVGSSYFTDANGDISEGTIINLKEVKIGDAVLKNVTASVVHNQKAPLLLGQSAFQKFGKIEIDNSKKVVTITYKKEKE